MSKKIERVLELVLVGTLIFASSFFTYKYMEYKSYRDSDTYKIADIFNIYDEYYIGEMDEETKANAMDMMLTAWALSNGDKYGVYIPASERADIEKTMTGEYFGIGIVISYPEGEDYTVVEEIYPNTPAEKAGLVVGTKIYKINGLGSQTEEGIIELKKLAHGEKKEVVLDTDMGELTIPLEKIDTETVYTSIEDGIATIKISSFAENTADEFLEDVEPILKDSNITHLIFDLRNNGGGDKDAVTKMVDRLAPYGVMYKEVYKDKTDYVYSDVVKTDIPIIILANEQSASASELFTMCLQDTNNAIMIGKTTYGKSTILSYIPLPDGSAIMLSTGYYYPPSDRFIEGLGIAPDIEVADGEDALERALQYIKTGK